MMSAHEAIIHRASVKYKSSKLLLTGGTKWRLHKNHANYFTQWDPFGDHGSHPLSVAYRHHGEEGTNVLFYDGHVEYRHKERVWFPDDSTQRNLLWETYNND